MRHRTCGFPRFISSHKPNLVYPELDVTSLEPANLPGVIFLQVAKVALVNPDEIGIGDGKLDMAIDQRRKRLSRIQALAEHLGCPCE